MSPDKQKPFRINGEIIRIHEDGIGVKFKIESRVQEAAIKSLVDMIQSGWESAHHVAINEDDLTMVKITIYLTWQWLLYDICNQPHHLIPMIYTTS